ncbi:MAG: type II toxin-antitoxin system HicB family antitoxin [Fimbriimonadales bacterium]|nr:type II toxin-antitoxin system HicB family antitoxin [Fimbriimonadales bacterium]
MMAQVSVRRQVPFTDYIEEAVRRAVIECEPDGCTATVPDLAGCITFGNTPAEALENLRDAVEAWVLTAIRFGDPVPTLGDVELAYTA